MVQDDTVVSKSDIIDYCIDDIVSTVTFKRCGKKFTVILEAVRLLGTVFLEQYLRMVRRELAGEIEEFTVCEWMMAPCVSHIWRLAPRPARDARYTLRDYIFPIMFRLEIVGSSRLVAYCAEFSATGPVGMSMQALCAPQFPGVPKFRASAVTIAEYVGGGGWSAEQKRVRVVGGDEDYSLRQIGCTNGFRRELCALRAIASLPSWLRTPKLCGIVTSDDGETILGILVTYIESRGNLHRRELRRMRQHHAAWKTQVKDTVRELHRNGMTWGYVGAENIVIDDRFGAWVVDFCGGHGREHMMTELCRTPDGELHEIEEIFDELDGRDGSEG